MIGRLKYLVTPAIGSTVSEQAGPTIPIWKSIERLKSISFFNKKSNLIKKITAYTADYNIHTCTLQTQHFYPSDESTSRLKQIKLFISRFQLFYTICSTLDHLRRPITTRVYSLSCLLRTLSLLEWLVHFHLQQLGPFPYKLNYFKLISRFNNSL